MKKHFQTTQCLQLFMKISLLQLLFAVIFTQGVTARDSLAQDDLLTIKVNLQVENQDYRTVLLQLEKVAGVHFTYRAKLFDIHRKVSLSATNEALSQVLDRLFRPLNIGYETLGKQIILSPQKEPLPPAGNSSVISPDEPEDRSITGTVLASDTQEGLPGVSIVVKGTTTGTTTDGNGKYKITVPEGSTLIFSFVGYTTEEIPVGNQSVLDVQLVLDINSLSEIVVVGYGEQKKANLTGSVATIDPKVWANRPITNSTQALQGVPGVFINQTKGRPGAEGATIRIRGVGTLNNSNPLVLVDGIEFPLGDVNPSDIESITVLKDAASAAIYGNRAANGVVLVKTKTGKQGKFQVDYNVYAGSQQATQFPDAVSNAVEYMTNKNQALANEGKPAEYSQALIEEYSAGTDPYIYPNTNWFEVMFRKAPIQEHNLRFSGGNEKTLFSVSMGYLNQGGIMINTWAKKYTLSSNITSDITSRLKIGASLLGTYWVDRESAYTADEGNGEGGIMGLTYRGLPMQAPYAQDGSYADHWVRVPGHNFFRNPLALSYEGFRRNTSLRTLANFFAEYKLPFNLRYRITASANLRYGIQKFAYPQIDLTNTKTGTIAPMGNIPARGVRQTSLETVNLTNFHTLNWDKKLGSVHNLTGLLGFSVETFHNGTFTASNQGYLSNELTELNAGSTTPLVGGTSSKSRLLSYFGRANYDFAGKYLAEANFRYDGSSRFAKGNRWGFFPSLSVGWRISEEAFLRNNRIVSNLKLRASWGRLGNQLITLFSYADAVAVGQSNAQSNFQNEQGFQSPTYNNNYSFNNTILSGAAIIQLSDPNITWETTSMTDIGLDAGFFNNRLTLELDWFDKRSSNILRQISVPAQVGNLLGPYQNIGSVSNKGFEVTAGFRSTVGQVGYNVGGNVTYIVNKVVDLRGQRYFSLNNSRIIQEGSPIDAFYGLQVEGIFQSEDEIKNHAFQNKVTVPGDLKYRDIDNNNIIDNNDRVVIGNSIPKFTYSFSLGADYKGIELSTFFQGVQDVDTYVSGNLAQPFRNGAGVTSEWLNDSWRPDRPNAPLPRLTTATGYPQNFQTADFWVQDASYLRLKNIQLSYSLPVSLVQKVKLSRVKVFVNAQNYLTFTKFKLGDPERELTRGDLIEYPNYKTLSGGLNLTF